MSNDEDPPLRDIVAQTLTASGVLPKIKAELRANVFHALEKTQDVSEFLSLNKELSSFSKTERGSLVLNLIREFLQFFNLDFTLAVFEPESCCGSTYHELTRQELLKKCKISVDKKMPLLCDILNLDTPSNVTDLSSSKIVDSPIALNATYVKDRPSTETTPVRFGVTDSPVVSVPSSQGSSEESKTPEKQDSGDNSEVSDPLTPPDCNDKKDDSLNLLMFTPVKEVKAVPKQKTEQPEPPSNDKDRDDKLNQSKPESKSDSIVGEKKTANGGKVKSSGGFLSDLPPLAGLGKATVGLGDLPPLGSLKQKPLNDVVKVMEELNQSLNSNNSKVEENGRPGSADSQRTITSITSEEVDEDISELLNSHPTSDGGGTEDVTISQMSNCSGLDHVESL